MDATMPGQYQLPTQYYPPTTTGGSFIQTATLPDSYQNHAPLVSVNEIYQQYQAQTSIGLSSYQLNSTLGNFVVNPLPLPVSAWPQPSSSSHTANFGSRPFVNEFASNPSTNLRDGVWSTRDSQGSVATFQSSSSGKRPRQELEDPSEPQPDAKKTRLNSRTDSSSAVLGSNMEVQSGSTAKPPCRGYRTVMLCNDELREQLKLSPGQIPTKSRLFFLGGFPIVAHINQPRPSPEEIVKREEKARREERSTGVPLTTEETEWLVNAYSHQNHSTATSTPPNVFPRTSERVGRSHQYHFDTVNAAPTPHQSHHQQFGHRNQDLYVDAVGHNALPNHAQPASLQREPFQVPGSMIMMHGAGGSSQSPQFPAAVASGFLDPGSSAVYDETAGMSNWIPQATEGPTPYPPSALQGSNFVVEVGANESNPTLITSPIREGVDNLMGHGYIGSVPRPFQVFQGSDLLETLSKTTTDDDDDKSLFGAFSE